MRHRPVPGQAAGPMRPASLILARIDDCVSDALVRAHLSEALRAQAPEQPPARASAWLAGRVLLSRQLDQGPLPPLPIGPFGKPGPATPRMPAFNISHSGAYVAVLLGADASPLGCDIECIRPRRGLMTIARQYFSPAEVGHLESLDDDHARTEAFWTFWTLREAILKQRGGTVWDMASVQLRPHVPYAAGCFMRHWCAHGVSIACCLDESATPSIRLIDRVAGM